MVRNFDQVEIGVAKVHRKNRPACPGTLNWTVEELHAARPQVIDDARDRHARDQAEVRGSRDGPIGLGLEFFADLVQVDLALPEGQRRAAAAEGDRLHAQDVAVEGAGAVGVARGDADEVELLDESHALHLRW